MVVHGRSAAGMAAEVPMGLVEATSFTSASTPASAVSKQAPLPPMSGYFIAAPTTWAYCV
jgi:hypothetical protein